MKLFLEDLNVNARNVRLEIYRVYSDHWLLDKILAKENNK